MDPPHHRPGGSAAGCMYLYGPAVKPPAERGTADEPIPSDTSAGRPKKERIPITEAEAKKAKTLTVSELDLKAFHNAVRHWTLRYEGTWGEHPQSILRRGREFTISLTFDREFHKKKDQLFLILSADEDTNKPTKNLRARFEVEKERERWGTEGPRFWTAMAEGRLEGSGQVSVRVYIPGDCPVGYWTLQVMTKQRQAKDSYVYVCPRPLIILFNPWSEGSHTPTSGKVHAICNASSIPTAKLAFSSEDDQVHFTNDKRLLDEYVLNDEGAVFMGNVEEVRDKPWYYGQFEENIVDICLSLLKKAFNGRMTKDMGDPVIVARALSRIVNSSNDRGVLQGNWSGDYAGGMCPLVWNSSVPILQEFHATQEPVKYGQCWVFSHTLTTVCRALGLPCRSVTNFASAHDTDATCTIDIFLDEEGDVLGNKTSDSIWNFHVWNEVWILRPDLKVKFYEEGYDGWHVIDATPQEQSLGLMQCGPCPVKAVKRGEIGVGFDTAFVFSEVNAELVYWTMGEEGDFDTISSISHNKVGQKISSLLPEYMKPTDTPDEEKDKTVRMDLTSTYKYPEGSEEEREAVKRAVRYCRYGSKIFNKCSELTVTLEPSPNSTVGAPVLLTARVTNDSGKDKDVLVTIAARATTYWDFSRHSQLLAKENLPVKTLKAGQTETFSLTVSPEHYMTKCTADWVIHSFACARDLRANMPYSAQRPYQLSLPQLRVQAPASAKSGEPITLTASFTNPLSVPLTKCQFILDGKLGLAPSETRTWVRRYGVLCLDLGSEYQVAPLKDMTFSVQLVGTWKAEDERVTKTTVFAFRCEELGFVEGRYVLKKAT